MDISYSTKNDFNVDQLEELFLSPAQLPDLGKSFKPTLTDMML